MVGLGSPNIRKYYQVAQLAKIPKRHDIIENPTWVSLEALECDPVQIQTLPWVNFADRPPILNPVLQHTMQIWEAHKYSAGLQSSTGPLMSFLEKPAFGTAFHSPASLHVWSISGDN